MNQVMRDITDAKRAREALRASEEQYRAIFNASTNAMILWDSRVRRVDVNAAYERTYGWTREEVLGQGFGCDPLHAAPRDAAVAQALGMEQDAAPVVIDGKVLFQVRGTSLLPASRRAAPAATPTVPCRHGAWVRAPDSVEDRGWT